MQADRDTRTEAATRALVVRIPTWTGQPPGFWHEQSARDLLAAADADDRENGIVRIKLDDELGRTLWHALITTQHAGIATQVESVLDVLREAVQP